MAGDDPDAGKEIAEGFLEALFAKHGGGAAGFLHDHGDFALIVNEGGDAAGGDGSAGMIVGGNEAREAAGFNTGIEGDDGDPGGEGSFDGGGEGAFIGGRESDALDALGDQAIEDLDLAGMIGFIAGSVPDDLEVVFAGGLIDSGANGHEEEMRGGFGDDTDAGAGRGPAGGEAEEPERNEGSSEQGQTARQYMRCAQARGYTVGLTTVNHFGSLLF